MKYPFIGNWTQLINEVSQKDKLIFCFEICSLYSYSMYCALHTRAKSIISHLLAMKPNFYKKYFSQSEY